MFQVRPLKRGLKNDVFEAWETEHTALVISVQMSVLSATEVN